MIYRKFYRNCWKRKEKENYLKISKVTLDADWFERLKFILGFIFHMTLKLDLNCPIVNIASLKQYFDSLWMHHDIFDIDSKLNGQTIYRYAAQPY